MKHRALIISHADGDGHIIAEQVRRNLSLTAAFDVDVVVDPERTRDHRSWMKLDSIREIEDANWIFFLDLMFSPKTFYEEAGALVSFVQDRPSKKFFLMDHHPLPLRRLGWARDLRVVYRPDVFECALGPRSGMMVVAALCERQFAEVADIKRPIHETLALGMRRASALGGGLPGNKLMALLKADRWDAILQLGNDNPEHHRLPRGRRSFMASQSDTLKYLDEEAGALLAPSSNARNFPEAPTWRTVMAYDADVGQERFSYDDGRRFRRNNAIGCKDLEAIVTLLEVAALSLTTEPGATFTLERLIEEVREISGDELPLDERDIRIVMKKATFVAKVGSQFCLR